MSHLFYLLFLFVGIGGLMILDWRYKLAFWYNTRQTLFTLLISVGVFIIWDILGIVLGIFLHGTGPYNLPFTIAPEFPIEELFFLWLLCYSALIIYRGVQRWRSRTSA